MAGLPKDSSCQTVTEVHCEDDDDLQETWCNPKAQAATHEMLIKSAELLVAE